MTAVDEGWSGYETDEQRIKKLEKRMKVLETRIADASRAGFAWAGYLIHGTPESVAEVRRLVEKAHEAL